jgi:hypothetical protein
VLPNPHNREGRARVARPLNDSASPAPASQGCVMWLGAQGDNRASGRLVHNRFLFLWMAGARRDVCRGAG